MVKTLNRPITTNDATYFIYCCIGIIRMDWWPPGASNLNFQPSNIWIHPDDSIGGNAVMIWIEGLAELGALYFPQATIVIWMSITV